MDTTHFVRSSARVIKTRISLTPSASPIMVVELPGDGGLAAVFANTLRSLQAIRDQDPTIVGIYSAATSSDFPNHRARNIERRHKQVHGDAEKNSLAEDDSVV